MKFSLFSVALLTMVHETMSLRYYRDGCCDVDQPSIEVLIGGDEDCNGQTSSWAFQDCYTCDPFCVCCDYEEESQGYFLVRSLRRLEGHNRRLDGQCKRGCPCFGEDGHCPEQLVPHRALRGEQPEKRDLEVKYSDRDCSICIPRPAFCCAYGEDVFRRLENGPSDCRVCLYCCDNSDTWDGVTLEEDCMVGCVGGNGDGSGDGGDGGGSPCCEYGNDGLRHLEADGPSQHRRLTFMEDNGGCRVCDVCCENADAWDGVTLETGCTVGCPCCSGLFHSGCSDCFGGGDGEGGEGGEGGDGEGGEGEGGEGGEGGDGEGGEGGEDGDGEGGDGEGGGDGPFIAYANLCCHVGEFPELLEGNVGNCALQGADLCYSCATECKCCSEIEHSEEYYYPRGYVLECKLGCPCCSDESQRSDESCSSCIGETPLPCCTYEEQVDIFGEESSNEGGIVVENPGCRRCSCCNEEDLSAPLFMANSRRNDCMTGCSCCNSEEGQVPGAALQDDIYECSSCIKGRSGAGAGGDPHVKTWSGDFFDFHGECDLALLTAPSFGNKTGLAIQIRTQGRHGYSFIKDAAIVIGNKDTDGDVLQVSSWSQYMINGVSEATLPYDLSGEYTVSFEQKDVNHATFTIDLGEEQAMVLKVFKDWISISLSSVLAIHFQDSVGLMGSFAGGAMVGRDGTTIFTDPNEFGQEWQVLESEPSLFYISRPPQQPHQACIMPDPAVAEGCRRLGETIDEEAAEIACAHHDEGHKKLCIYDVMVSGDIDVAQAGAF